MSKTKTIDLTSGPILKTLAELALPIMASSLLGTAYNITDMAWIGMLGSKAVAGVGVGGMYVWLSQGLVALPRMGGQVNVAQACGRGDYEQARGYAASALRLTFLLGGKRALDAAFDKIKVAEAAKNKVHITRSKSGIVDPSF